MAQHDVGRFMKQRRMRQLGDWVDRDLTSASVSLPVALHMREADPLNVQRTKCLLRVPFRQAWCNEFIADGL